MGNSLSQYARDRMYLCKKDGATDLNLSSCEIKKLPRAILKFKKTLTKLNVGKNFLTEFNSQIEKFLLLQTLIADSNELTETIPTLSKLEHLIHLDISNNLLTNVPNHLKHLQHLNISINSINSFPRELDLPALQELFYAHNKVSIFPTEILELRNLRTLDLAGNRLNYLPDEISSLAATLQALDLSENQFTSFPPPITTLTALRSLRLAGNQLGQLTSVFTNLSNLEVIDFSECQLTSFDFDLSKLVALTDLSLARNRISELSSQTAISLGQLKLMRFLDLSKGTFNSIPKQVGWLSNLRRLNVSENQITKLPGELSLLNPSIDMILIPNPLEYPSCEWIKDGIPLFLQHIKPYMRAYGPNSNVYNLEKTMYAMAPNQFNIRAMDFEGKPRISGMDKFEVRMLLDGASSPSLDAPTRASHHSSTFFRTIDCIVKDNKSTEPGTYTVFFNSPQTGSYVLYITTDDLPIKDSPFFVELVSKPQAQLPNEQQQE
ncbi:filamin/ABP280 repeat-containing protein [Cavenderia fasciculata]|uniref:Filamin/ABP280 repeat-containing protein n=1 Tax=Cavenderia fasciculata TaxID=261658 RepID=F4QDZ1_CACFS|nr:filamin/ABP280 repeat-containing protein [Cavenderia fasciculata]EGG13938.1 filamin/ABP280 repeat-containing protein [Cavenderia fasciculata]|eukprot:XP_004350646.1 filamin/ABP280 repeat-containing protein [Cavenderia fasciculata]